MEGVKQAGSIETQARARGQQRAVYRAPEGGIGPGEKTHLTPPNSRRILNIFSNRNILCALDNIHNLQYNSNRIKKRNMNKNRKGVEA